MKWYKQSLLSLEGENDVRQQFEKEEGSWILQG